MKAPVSRGTFAFFVVAVSLFCGAVLLTLFSAVSQSAAYLLSVVPGMAFAALFCVFRKKKIGFWAVLGAALLYTVLCVAAGFAPFYRGAMMFVNNVAFTANARMHWGFASFAGVTPSAAGDFLFCSVVSVWLSLGAAACAERVRVLAAIAAAVLLVWLCLGLIPAFYAAALTGVCFVALLACAGGFPLRSALCLVLCAAVVCSAAAPCFLYDGSEGMRRFRSALVYSAEKTFYGKDDLPEGNLQNAARMRTSDAVRFEVTLTPQVRTLYLKGFVGSELQGNVFKPTDKNAYVQNDYQGLIGYIAQGGLPITQYAGYAALNGHTEQHEISVVNRGANAKYIYAPYTVGAYTAGSPYYDMNLRANLFTPRRYSFTVFAGDKSCERVTQAHWLLEGANRTQAMDEYLALEGNYRAFVYEQYLRIDASDKATILAQLGGSASSINTAAQLIRRYFTDRYTYSKAVDAVGDDFLAAFYGGEIQNANAAYFAAAATCAFRAYGYPARYVEGYLVNPLGGTANNVTVTGKSSHAWTEVYFDGMGWLPIDVTPTFYVEQDPDAPVDPDDPNVPPVDPEDPDLDPDDPEDPPEPVDPAPKPSLPDDPQERNLLIALKVLVPVLGVALAVSLFVLAVAARRKIILKNKRKRLSGNGEAFGRAAYAVIARDLKRFGGFSPQTLQKLGIAESAYARFMQLIEKCVYGGYELNANERGYMLYFISNTAQTAARSGGKLRAFRCKYLLCIGLNESDASIRAQASEKEM